eukprot:PhM_4_TR15781/c0_g1_i1/m.100741
MTMDKVQQRHDTLTSQINDLSSMISALSSEVSDFRTGVSTPALSHAVEQNLLADVLERIHRTEATIDALGSRTVPELHSVVDNQRADWREMVEALESDDKVLALIHRQTQMEEHATCLQKLVDVIAAESAQHHKNLLHAAEMVLSNVV